MKMSEAFPSKYLKAEDLKGQRITVTIARVEMGEIGDGDSREQKPVVYFQGKEKGLVLNKTNAANISYMYGDETNDWTGSQIKLFTMIVPFQGRQVPAIRIAPPPGVSMEGAKEPDGRSTLTAPPAQARDLDDEIPF